MLDMNGSAVEAVRQAEEIVSSCSEAVLKMDTSDGGNADAFAEMYGDQFIYVPELGWLHWNGMYWQRDQEAVMLAMRDSFDYRHDRFYKCGDSAKANEIKRSTYKLNAAIEQAQSMLKRSIEDFDKDPDEINTENGVLNLRTLKLTPHKPEQLFTYALRAPYDKNADMSVWEEFIEGVLTKEGEETNQELVDFMQEALGMSLTGHTNEEKLFYLFGQLGRNGKGSITEAIMELVPYPIAQEVDFNTFVARRDGDSQNFDLADMKASRMLFASESNKYQMLNPASIKKLTGGNYVRAAHKFKGFFTYRPQYKVWLSSNHNVNGDPDDNVMWNRVLLIELPNSYQGREEKSLKTLLKSKDVQKGLLRWLVIGAKRWYERKNGLEIPKQVLLATKKQQESLDTFSHWLLEVAEPDKGCFEPYTDLYQNYKVWCEANGVTPKGKNQFTESLLKNGFVKVTKRNRRGYKGWRLVSEYQRVPNDEMKHLYLTEIKHRD